MNLPVLAAELSAALIAEPLHLPPNRSPVLVYLARLDSGSRRPMRQALGTIASE